VLSLWSVTPQHNSKEDSPSTEDRVAAIPPPTKNTSETKNRRQPSYPRRTLSKKAWRLIKRVFLKKDRLEKLGIAAGVVYAVITIIQWRDLRRNFAYEQRSWIKVDYLVPLKLDPSASIQVILHNVGKSPALRLEGGVMVQVVDADSSPAFPPGTVNVRKIVGNVMFPSDETSFSSGRTPNNPDGTVRPLDTDEVGRLSSGDAYLAVWGIVAYRDGFGDHWTRFCTWKTYQSGPKDFHTGGCVDWNSVGDGITKWESPHK